ncbi:MAG TPA: hypothetical protein PKC28_11735, partial [Bdellovibrionales bacterium]|nr:hypothetical protein [Bdellovibrionales bacterium]
ARPLMSQGISKNTVWRSVTTIPTGGMMRFLESRDSAGGTVMSGAACLPVENETGVLNCAADDAQGSYRLVTEEDGRLFIEFEFIHVDLGENYRPKEIRRADGRPVRVEGVIVECPKLSFEF